MCKDSSIIPADAILKLSDKKSASFIADNMVSFWDDTQSHRLPTTTTWHPAGGGSVLKPNHVSSMSAIEWCCYHRRCRYLI
jgi:hypothetical protein